MFYVAVANLSGLPVAGAAPACYFYLAIVKTPIHSTKGSSIKKKKTMELYFDWLIWKTTLFHWNALVSLLSVVGVGCEVISLSLSLSLSIQDRRTVLTESINQLCHH